MPGMLGGGGLADRLRGGGASSGSGSSYPVPPPVQLPPMPVYQPPAPVAPVTSTNTSEISPYLKKALSRLDDRYNSDDTARATQDSTLGIEDAAALSAADQKGGLSRRGLVGSEGGAAFLNKRVFAPAQRQAAGAAANIQLAQQDRLDRLTLGSTGLVTAPDAISAENRRIAQQQQSDQAAQQLAQQQAQQQQVNQWLSLLGGM